MKRAAETFCALATSKDGNREGICAANRAWPKSQSTGVSKPRPPKVRDQPCRWRRERCRPSVRRVRPDASRMYDRLKTQESKVNGQPRKAENCGLSNIKS